MLTRPDSIQLRCDSLHKSQNETLEKNAHNVAGRIHWNTRCTVGLASRRASEHPAAYLNLNSADRRGAYASDRTRDPRVLDPRCSELLSSMERVERVRIDIVAARSVIAGERLKGLHRVEDLADVGPLEMP
jgi:hypothetical protein